MCEKSKEMQMNHFHIRNIFYNKIGLIPKTLLISIYTTPHPECLNELKLLKFIRPYRSMKDWYNEVGSGI